MNSPAYIFDKNAFYERVMLVKKELSPEIPVCYSIKANPFLLQCLPDELDRIEVCSPGELNICEALEIDPDRIIYSGVMKEQQDVDKAVAMNTGIITAESLLHVNLIQNACKNQGVTRNVILRYTSGNQFGMSKEDIEFILGSLNQFPDIRIMGIHYFSGTQKKISAIEKDLKRVETLLEALKNEFNFEPELVEYGPGLPAYYFEKDGDEKEAEILKEAAKLLNTFAKKYPLGIEMGRFFAAPCGSYITKVKDIKSNDGTNYVICDGGMHHLNYYGQALAMKIPPLKVCDDSMTVKPVETVKEYALCGSLCTIADVFVRCVELPELNIGDNLVFGKCGAYSITEANALFLSRNMPTVYLKTEDGMTVLRKEVETYLFNK